MTSVLAGEKSGSLAEVLDRYLTYQKMALAVRKKLMVSLMYPAVLMVLVVCLMIFLVTYVVPNFAQLYSTMSGESAPPDAVPDRGGDGGQEVHPGVWWWGWSAAVLALRYWSRSEAAQHTLDRMKLRTPILGRIWIMYQVAQFARVLSTLLVGGIPLVQALETASESMSSTLMRKSLDKTKRDGAGRAAAVGRGGLDGSVSKPGHRHDRGGGIDGRAAFHAQQRGRVL